jgi:superfamily II DNA or RNA helicase
MTDNIMQIKPRPHQERGYAAMQQHNKGQLIYPTGGGKTLNMIMDAVREFSEEVIFEKEYNDFGEYVGASTNRKLIVVVAPRILLAEQLSSEFLEFIINAKVLHCHSGETHHTSTTNPKKIDEWVCDNADHHCLIFTTYNSLQHLVDAEVAVNTIYFDEAHNSVKRNFFPATEHFAAEANRCYFFTATRKTSLTPSKPGMNDRDVYGDIICRVSAPELVDGGYIIAPKIVAKKFDVLAPKQVTAECDSSNLTETLDDIDCKKILVCVKSAKQLINLMSHTDCADQLHQRGYSYLYITSKTGAIIDGKKVNREVFFDTLNSWGRDPNKKFVCFHRSILSEGINVSELEAVVFLRNMDVIEMTQTIGRVLRLGGKEKVWGLCVVPVYSKVGVSTERALQRVVDAVFEKGEMLDSVVRR